MRINNQLLRSRAHGPLHSVEYLDLSDLNIERIERLQCCPKLQSLSLRDNSVDYVSNLDHCQQLWKLDLGNNQIKSLEGLSRFMAIGTLILSNNQLTWPELNKLRHMHILDLSLHGNAKLEKDPYYRIHVIDSLPHVWMLDGRLVTSAERLQVQHFFQESALTDHPVRHKLSKETFRPTSRKNIEVNGIFGEKTTHLMRRFPVNGVLNRDMDQRRLQYLSYNVEHDLKLEMKHKSSVKSLSLSKRPFLEDLIEARTKERERCNMLLLLLVASLEFAMPSQLMKAALESTQMVEFEGIHIFELFLLPREARCSVVSLLLSAVKMDKDMGEEGGLYDKLYLCIYHCVSELTRLAHGTPRLQKENHQKKNTNTFRDSRCLLAAEVVQLLCIVPQFFQYLNKDVGVMNMMLAATGDAAMGEKLKTIMDKGQEVDQTQMYEEAAELILKCIQTYALQVLNKTSVTSSESSYILSTWKKALPRRPMSSPMLQSEYHSSGRTSPEKSANKVLRLSSAKSCDAKPQAKLGDPVLLGPQNIARIISMPESDIVLVQMDVVPAETGAMVSNSKNPEEHYTYINLNQVYWDQLAGYWRPKGTIGDRITIQSMAEQEKAVVASAEKFASKCCHRNIATPAPPCSPRGATGMLPSPRNLLLDMKGRHRRDTLNSPRAVSTQFKEKYNLRLDVGGASNPLGKVDVPERPATTRPDSTANTTEAAPRPHSQAPRIEISDSQEVSGGSVFVEGTAISRPSSTGVSTRNLDPSDASDTDAVTVISRRSSLESAEESELVPFMQDSRPSTRPDTAHSRKSGVTSISMGKTESVVPVTPDCPIEIPQVTEDPDSQNATPASSTRHEHPGSALASTSGSLLLLSVVDGDGCTACAQEAHERAVQLQAELETDSGNSGRQLPGNRIEPFDDSSVATVQCSSTAPSRKSAGKAKVTRAPLQNNPPQLGAVDGYRMIVSRDTTSYGTPYQNQRTEAWRHTPISSTPAGSEVGPPPQRPSSPIQREKNGQGGLRVQRGDTWLAGGRDLYWESLHVRPKSSHSPGWKEGVSSRPKSAAALRAMRRSKTPNIVTPSSLAYDYAYGPARSNHSPDIATTSEYSNPSPVPPIRSDNINIDDFWFLTPKRVRFYADGFSGGGYFKSSIRPPPPPPAVDPMNTVLCGNCIFRYNRNTESMPSEDWCGPETASMDYLYGDSVTDTGAPGNIAVPSIQSETELAAA